MNRFESTFVGLLVIGLVGFFGLKMSGCNVEQAKQKQAADQRLHQAWKAVEEGRSLGTPPPIGEPRPQGGPPNDPARGVEPKIVAAGKAQREGGDPYAARQAFLEIREEIKALADTSRKQDLLYTLASYQARGKFNDDAVQTAGLMPDADRRIDFLIAAGSNYNEDKNIVRQSLLRAAAEIGQLTDPSHRDRRYAELAFAQKTQGLVDDQKTTCNLILSAEHKTSTTCR